MGFLTFLIFLLVVLILFIIVSTVIKFVLFVTIKYKYDNHILLLPSVLSFINWILLIIIWYITLTRILNVDMQTLFFNILLKKSSIANNIQPIFLSTLIFCVMGIIIQSFIFLTVNIDYIKLFGNIRLFAKNKIIKKSLENIKTSNLKINEKPEKLTFSNAFVSSLFAFSSVLFCLLILLAISNILSQKILS